MLLSGKKKLSQSQARAIRRKMQEIARVERDKPYVEQRRRAGEERAQQKYLLGREEERRVGEDDRQRRAVEEIYKRQAREREWTNQERLLKRTTDYDLLRMLQVSPSLTSSGPVGRSVHKLVNDYYESRNFSGIQRKLAIECLKADFMNK